MSDATPDLLTDDVDPQVRQFVDAINEGYVAAEKTSSGTLEERRAIGERVRQPWIAGGPKMAETTDFEAHGVRCRLYRPIDQNNLPVMLYIHGGGWVLFSIDTHDRLMREYACRAGIAVIGIDYSRAPESKFPVALDEIVTVVRWVRDRCDDLGIDAGRMVLGGDSAGGNLTVAACLKLRELGQPPVQAMLLNYGAFSAERTASYKDFGGPNYCLTPDEMDAFWNDYLDDPSQQSTDPLVAPLHAELHDLPPAFVAIAPLDILADCNRAMAKKLRNAGVPVMEVEYEGATHSFLEAVSIASLAQRAFDDQAKWLQQTLNML